MVRISKEEPSVSKAAHVDGTIVVAEAVER